MSTVRARPPKARRAQKSGIAQHIDTLNEYLVGLKADATARRLSRHRRRTPKAQNVQDGKT